MYVRGEAGGMDTATLNGTAGNDTFVARSNGVYLRNTSFHHEVRGFDSVYGVATQGGYDEAYLFDTAGDDVFVGAATYSSLEGGGLLHHVSAFDYVFSSSENGGVDEARFLDSSGTENFTAGAGYAYMVGSAFTNNTTGYRTVRAESSNTQDRAFLYDSAGNDLLTASGSTAILDNTAGRTTVSRFKRVDAFGVNGGTNTLNKQTIDYVLRMNGTWN